MATMSERVSVTYTGDVAVEVSAGAAPNPSIVQPGEAVEVDAWAAESLLTSGGPWAATGKVPDGVLRGEQLDAALRAAGLPTTGRAAEKRARLAEWEAVVAQQLADHDDPEHGSYGAWQDPDPEADPSSATPDDVEETEA